MARIRAITTRSGVIGLSLPFVGFAVLLCGGYSLASISGAAAQDLTPKGIVADQIRSQGYKCDDPQNAERDLERSKPDEAVWVLRCEDATYRVTLIPDLAARVERID